MRISAATAATHDHGIEPGIADQALRDRQGLGGGGGERDPHERRRAMRLAGEAVRDDGVERADEARAGQKLR